MIDLSRFLKPWMAKLNPFKYMNYYWYLLKKQQVYQDFNS